MLPPLTALQFAIFLASIALAAYPLSDPLVIEAVFPLGTYVILWLLIVVACYTLQQSIRFKQVRQITTQHWPGILLCAGLVLLVALTIHAQLRIFADEPSLLADSKSMASSFRAEQVRQQLYSGEELQTYEVRLGFRPYLYPFIVHLLHKILGYRIENAFLANNLLYFSLLLGVYAFVASNFGRLWGCTAAVLVAAQPVLSLNAQSAGYDLCAAVFALLSMLGIWRFCEAPSELRFRQLFLSLLFLCHTRFESILYLPLILVLLLFAKFLRWEFFSKSFVYALSPIFIAPLLWQRLYHIDIPKLAEGKTIFSLSSFVSNNSSFLKTLLLFNRQFPFNSALHLLGIIGGFLLLAHALKGRLSNSHKHFVVISFVCGGCFWLLMTAHFWSDIQDPYVNRHYLPFSIAFSLLALYGFRHLWQKLSLPAATALLPAVLLFVLYFPTAVTQSTNHIGPLAARYHHVLTFTKKQDGKKILLVDSNPRIFTIHDLAAIDFATLRSKPLAYWLGQGYEGIYAMQFARPGRRPEVSPKQEIPKDCKAATVDQLDIGEFYGRAKTGVPQLRIVKLGVAD